ncbi:MAG: hypothetical protein HKN82_12810 [Akkermansiaceae bacterium]|nr:hypothetical protein [Akkermansiaceae bacterium]NNM28233.1 hypothetical protein [Akkermansiaceae bacterium]
MNSPEPPKPMTPTGKLRAAQSLRDSAWALKAAWLRHKHPDWTEPEVEAEVRKAFAHTRD